MAYEFLDENGTFELKQAIKNSYLYFPLTNEGGIMSAISPDGHGDCKISQNEFLMEPVSQENLHSSMVSRNFWLNVAGFGPWSVYGVSARQYAVTAKEKREESSVVIGKLWHKQSRRNPEIGIRAEVRTFCPPARCRAELMQVTVKNEGKEKLTMTPVAAIPIYGRSADNLRDHRHVTSLLNRIYTTEWGVTVKPTLSFDERGHSVCGMSYSVFGREDNGDAPEGYYPVLSEFIGEGGNLLWPEAVVMEKDSIPAGEEFDGCEAMGGIRFKTCTVKPGEEKTYLLVLSFNEEGMEYLRLSNANAAFDGLKTYWDKKSAAVCRTGDLQFDRWMEWVGIQPTLRKIFGCSFLPHHDYGKGGRGWRDLWQDCLALILTNPSAVRQDLIQFFRGVRMDGSNATIIGRKPGEFKADRNSIQRLWMDHGYWPLVTVSFYLNQTGDYDILHEIVDYFDTQGKVQGTILEHIIMENAVRFFDVGEHNCMRLQGADWNDALDMAKERGESVAFMAAYSGNFYTLDEILDILEKKGIKQISLLSALAELIAANPVVYDDAEKKNELLKEYEEKTVRNPEKKVMMPVSECRGCLVRMGQWIQSFLRSHEVIHDDKGNIWFNGYYDNSGHRLEGMEQGRVRMMLTSQVFTLMSRTATDEQVAAVCKSVETYLYDKELGGYRLNTDFKEVKLDMGRAFGFAYGHKENGSVFSHMAVMYAYSLYNRKFVKEGYRVVSSLCRQSMNFEQSRIYPGIPEYFNDKGRGMYHYLTGAASWLMLLVITQMFGVRGKAGSLIFAPCLTKEQFDENGEASIYTYFSGKKIHVVYKNADRKDYGDYEIVGMQVDGTRMESGQWILTQEYMKNLNQQEHTIEIILE